MLIFDERRLRRTRDVLFLLVVFLRAVFLRVVFLLLGAARLFTLRLLVVVFLLGEDFLLVVFFLRVVLRLFGAAFLLVVLLLRVVFLLLGAAFLRVTFRRRVVLLRFGEARRRVVVFLLVDLTLFADFLLAILFIPLFFERTLFFLFEDLRFAAGLRGLSITTSAKGMRSNLSDSRVGYKERVLVYVRVIHL